jgi:hypothetical protein
MKEKSPIRWVLPLACVAILDLAACKDNEKDKGGGLVADASLTQADAGATPANVDINQCVGCATPAPFAWTFEGIYRDDKCTDPLAQLAAGACAQIPALGPTNLTYNDEVGPRKAGEAAQVTLTDQVDPTAPKFRKSGTKCVKVNDGAVNLTPTNCGGLRVCRDATGGLTCAASCRTLSTGCPDFEESRLYAGFTDPNMKKPGGGGGNGGRLAQCCNALAAEAKRLGSSPEAGVIATAAAQCQVLAAQVGPNGTAPELGAIRTALQGRPVPAVCQGF